MCGRLFASQKDAVVKITDFGLSKFFDEQSSLMKTPCGTPGYIAPEVLHMRGYDKQCDVWSFGVIVYILLCGFPPFYADNDAQLFERIKRGKYEFIKPYWDPISEEAKAFVRRMLESILAAFRSALSTRVSIVADWLLSSSCIASA